MDVSNWKKKKIIFLKKRAPAISPPIESLFSVFFYQNKSLQNFLEREQHLIVGHIKGSRLGPATVKRYIC